MLHCFCCLLRCFSGRGKLLVVVFVALEFCGGCGWVLNVGVFLGGVFCLGLGVILTETEFGSSVLARCGFI